MASKYANIDCYVKLSTGKTLTFDLGSSDMVSKIYDRVSEDLNVAVEKVTIKYQGKVLKRNDTVGYLGICKETILKAEVTVAKPCNLDVKVPGGKTIQVQVENLSPVKFIKVAVENQEGIPFSEQILMFGGKAIPPAQDIERCADIGIIDGCTVTVEKRSHAKPSTANGAEDKPDISETEKSAVLGTFDAAGRSVEVVFSFDTTGSMYSCLDNVRSKLEETIQRLIQNIPNIRIGVIAHGDYCDYELPNYVLMQHDLTDDCANLVEFVNTVGRTGGGDAPECYEYVLRKAQQLDWSENSAKALVIIADDHPHVQSFTNLKINWHDELDVLKGMGVKVYGVQALNQRNSTPFYQQLADVTGGAYITFNNFNIIAEMFLAVCYREASDEQFAQYIEEVEQEVQDGSNQAADVRNVLQQLENSPNVAQDDVQRYVAESWWDPKLDHGTEQYHYDETLNEWSSYRGHNNFVHYSPPSSSSSSPTKRSSIRDKLCSMRNKHRRGSSKKSCSIM